MANDNGDNNIKGIAEAAARSTFLTALARAFSIITPMIFLPMLVWLFSTVSDTQLNVIKIVERAEAVDRRLSSVEDNIKETDARNAVIIEERRKDWIDIRERTARLEAQNAAIIEQLGRLIDKLDSRPPGKQRQ